MITKSDAIVLRAIPYGETSSIVSVFTKEHGRLSMMAKGARRPKSKFGSSLQPMSVVEAVYRFKEHGLSTLTDCGHKHLLYRLSDDLHKISIGLRMVELVRIATEESQPFDEIYEALEESLIFLNREATRVDNVHNHFQMRLSAVLGFAPMVDKQQLDELGDEVSGWLDLSTGAVSVERPPSSSAYRASRQTLRSFGILSNTSIEVSSRLGLSDAQIAEVSSVVEHYVRFHLERAYPARSGEIHTQLVDAAKKSSD